MADLFLVHVRNLFAADSTEGEVLIDDEHQCYILELPVKDGLPGSAIPAGIYEIKLLPSPKFLSSSDPWVLKYASRIPHIINIPERSNILQHWGNTIADTEGCQITGSTEMADFVGESRLAFEALHAKYEATVQAGGRIFIQVVGGGPNVGSTLPPGTFNFQSPSKSSNKEDVQSAASGDN